jgi:hypothetical protein
MIFIKSIPLFLYLLLGYNLVLYSGQAALFGVVINAIKLPSGGVWILDMNTVIIALGIISLYIETLKATRTSVSSVIDHALSMVVFVAFLVEFIVFKPTGNSVFFLLTLLSMLDVIAGFTITIMGARRDVAVN